ncbi:MFS transporter [Pseudomonas asuensis]
MLNSTERYLSGHYSTERFAIASGLPPFPIASGRAAQIMINTLRSKHACECFTVPSRLYLGGLCFPDHHDGDYAAHTAVCVLSTGDGLWRDVGDADLSIYAAGVIAALLVAGSWSDQLGRRPMLLAGIALSAVSTVMFLFSHSIGGLMLARLFSGFSAGIYTGTATVAVLELAPEPWRNVSTLVATASNMLGLGLGPLVAGILSTYLPYPTHLVFSLYLIYLAVAATGVLLAHETVQRPARPRLQIQRPHLPREIRVLFIPAALSGMAGLA